MINLDDLINKITCADCMYILKKLPDKCIDLVLTDPPYGIIKEMSLRTTKNIGKAEKWDIRPNKEYFDEIFRISKNQIIWGYQYFISNFSEGKGIIFWDKKNGDNFMSDGELAFNSCTNAVRIYRYAKIGKDNYEPTRIHPTQKPLKLFEWCICKFTNENDLVLDCFSGSGTTAIACHRLKRRFICIEKDPEYWEASCKRLEDEQRQGVLL